MPIDATVGGASANSYATLAEAEAYFGSRLFTDTWDDLSEANKEAALIWATRVIEGKISEDWTKKSLPNDATIRVLSNLKADSECYLVWTGRPASEDQSLSWPRADMAGATGFPIADNIIPDRIKEFQFEVALKLAAGDRTEENAATAQGLSSLTAGPVSLAWNGDAPNPRLIPDALFKSLAPSWWYAFELVYKTQATFRVL